jgi:hypothetical protein
MKTMRSLKWLRPLLVVLFMSYYVGGTAFTHTHHFLNYSITHSHPYLPGADGLPHHEHSTVAFNTIEELTELCMELIGLGAFDGSARLSKERGCLASCAAWRIPCASLVWYSNLSQALESLFILNILRILYEIYIFTIASSDSTMLLPYPKARG